MLRRTGNDKGFILNPYYEERWLTERNTRRRKLFKTGVFRVTKDRGWFALLFHGRFIGGWLLSSTNHVDQARDIIDTAFLMYEALCDLRFENMIKGVE